MARRAWFPDRIDGSLVVLRRHAPGNLRAFLRWYSDPEVARLTRKACARLEREQEALLSRLSLSDPLVRGSFHVRTRRG